MTNQHEVVNGYENSIRVVYLIGAGASHACVDMLGSSHGILMEHLTQEIAECVREKAQKYGQSPSVAKLANEVIDASTDMEQVITFLDESSSADHQEFANDLRQVFETVLRKRFGAIQTELEKVPADLYAALIDMHSVRGFPETLGGILTINYDVYIEHAIEKLLDLSVDYGINLDQGMNRPGAVTVLKLHGSFGWQKVWPVKPNPNTELPLWIPPGIQKAKGNYPFNLLWGRARELLDCDIVRIVGCNLGSNDWDLLSMLFAAQHANRHLRSLEIEIIGRPNTAKRIRKEFPYLRAKSILELDGVGEQIVGEMSGGEPRAYNNLTQTEQQKVDEEAQKKIRNPLLYWLKQKAEVTYQDLGSLETDKGFFNKLFELY